MNIRLLPFAVLRDALGYDERVIDVEPGTTVLELWSTLRRTTPALERFSVPPMFAVNESYVASGVTLADGDSLALIPPVSGG